eukprot:1160573-Pelagomonas_calceolata.AAC.1
MCKGLELVLMRAHAASTSINLHCSQSHACLLHIIQAYFENKSPACHAFRAGVLMVADAKSCPLQGLGTHTAYGAIRDHSLIRFQELFRILFRNK